MRKVFLIVFLALGVVQVQAQTLQDFTLPNASTPGNFSLSDLREAKAVVLIFTSNYCPYAKLYDGRLATWIGEHQDETVRFVLVNPNSKFHPRYESLEEMAKKAQQQNYTVPYLSDADQKLSTNLGATRTPEVFVLRKVGNEFRVVYKGALDDNPQLEDNVQAYYLVEVIQAIKAGKPVPANQRATGCMIKTGS